VALVISMHPNPLESHQRQQWQMLCEFILKAIPPDALLIMASNLNGWRLQSQQIPAPSDYPYLASTCVI